MVLLARVQASVFLRRIDNSVVAAGGTVDKCANGELLPQRGMSRALASSLRNMSLRWRATLPRSRGLLRLGS